MGALTTKVIKKITDISFQEWDRVFPPIAESYFFFKTIEESGFGGISFYYILVYDGSRLVGIAPVFSFNYSLDTTVSGPIKKTVSWLVEAFPGLLRPKALICGMLAAEGRIGLVGDNKAEVVKAISRSLDDLARETKSVITAFKDFSDDYTGYLDGLLKSSYGKVESFPVVDLKLDFKGFDEYLSGLSHITRKELRRKFKKVDAAVKIEFKAAVFVEDIVDEIYGLYMQTFLKSDVQFEKLNKEFFINIARNMPGQVKYFLWYIDNKLIAFNLCLSCGDTLVDEYIGLDYAVAYQYHLYFITFRDILKWCLNNGIKMYKSGALTYDPKKRLGCRFIPLYIYAKHTNGFLNLLLKIFCRLIRPENFDKTLKSMKKEGLL